MKGQVLGQLVLLQGLLLMSAAGSMGEERRAR